MEQLELEEGKPEYFILYIDLKESDVLEIGEERSEHYIIFDKEVDTYRIFFREPIYNVNDFDMIDATISEPNYCLSSGSFTCTLKLEETEHSLTIQQDDTGVITMESIANELRRFVNVRLYKNKLYLQSDTSFELYNISETMKEYLNAEHVKSIPHMQYNSMIHDISTFNFTTTSSSGSGLSSGSGSGSGTISLSNTTIQSSKVFTLEVEIDVSKTLEKMGNLMFHCTEIESSMPNPPLYKRMQGLYKYTWGRSNRYLIDINHNAFSPLQKVLELNVFYKTRSSLPINAILRKHHSIADFSIKISYLNTSKSTFKKEIKKDIATFRSNFLKTIDVLSK